MMQNMSMRRFDFEKLTVSLAIPLILVIAAATAFMLIGAVTDHQRLRSIGAYLSIPIFVWTAIPFCSVVAAISFGLFRVVVRQFSPEAFPRKIDAPLTYLHPSLVTPVKTGLWSDDEIARMLLAGDNTRTIISHDQLIISPESGLKVVEVEKSGAALEVNSDIEQACVNNLRQPGETKKLVLLLRTVDETTLTPICDFIYRIISGALEIGTDMQDRLRVFIPVCRDQLVIALWKRLSMNIDAMHRLGADDAYQLLAIVMQIFLVVPAIAE